MVRGLLVADEPHVVEEAPASDVGEGPVWDEASQSLLWVDVTGGAVHRYWPSDRSTWSRSVPGMIGAAAFNEQSGLLLALEDGVYLADQTGHRSTLLARPAGLRPGFRLNDGKVAPDGRFWVGTLALDGRRVSCELSGVDVTGAVTTLRSGVGLSNGLDWSPDGSSFYYVDSHVPAILRFTWSHGDDLGEAVVFADLAGVAGMADGLTVDAEGYVWIAMWGGSAVHRFSPQGTLVGSVRLPVTNVTSCAFGGPGLSTLFITTARYGLSHEELATQPAAGRLFAVTTTFQGRSSPRFSSGSAATPTS